MKTMKIICTAKDTGNRLSYLGELKSTPAMVAQENIRIIIDTKVQYQKLLGFGGAFTVSSGVSLGNVGKHLQEKALNAYFHPQHGLGYQLGRMHLGSCDFSTEAYSYNDTSGDIEMKNFSIEYDRKWLIPMIKAAQKISGENLLLYGTPWSPPKWMKSNQMMEQGGKLLKEYYPAMALYFAKYIKSYAQEGISIWGISVQNEPEEIQAWPSCHYTAEEEKEFITEYLIPCLNANDITNLKLLVWDSNKDKILDRARGIFKDEKVRNHIWGTAFHWYSGDYFEDLETLHEEFPQKALLSTESCVVFPENLNDWDMAERYGHDIIGDLNNWTVGYIDWNLFLNEHGGPSVADNYCASPIIIDSKKQELIYLSSYYYIGHFSKYMKRGAYRIACSIEGTLVEVCAVKNPDGEVVIVIMNPQEQSCTIVLEVDEIQFIVEIMAHSIITLLYR